jgi:hypothetical protein
MIPAFTIPKAVVSNFIYYCIYILTQFNESMHHLFTNRYPWHPITSLSPWLPEGNSRIPQGSNC